MKLNVKFPNPIRIGLIFVLFSGFYQTFIIEQTLAKQHKVNLNTIFDIDEQFLFENPAY